MVARRPRDAQDAVDEGGKIERLAVPLDTQMTSSRLAEDQGEGVARKVTFPEDRSGCTDYPPVPFSPALIVAVGPHRGCEGADSEDGAASYASDEAGKRDDVGQPAEVVAQTQRRAMPRLCFAISAGANGQLTHQTFDRVPTTTHMLQVS